MILLFKLASAPVLILGVTLLARRWGPVVGGLAMGVPLITGPVSIITAIEQGAVFAREAAVANLVGQVSTCLFCFAFAQATLRFGVWACLAIGVATFFAATMLWSQVGWSLVSALALLVASLFVLARSIPAAKDRIPARIAPAWDLPARMLVSAAFVLAITGVTPHLGPQLSGLVAPFPVFTLVLAGFTHLTQGPIPARAMMRGVIIGSLSFAAFFTVVASCLEPNLVMWVYLGATIASVTASSLVYLVLHLAARPWPWPRPSD
jgi:hypothetical protein